MQCRCHVEVYYFPFGVQGTTSPHAHSFGRLEYIQRRGCQFCLFIVQVFLGPNETDGQKHRYPAFLFVFGQQGGLICPGLGI
jgi:hypothetical protein